MRLRLTAAALVLFAVPLLAAAAPPDYSGHWTLSKEQSANLPNFYDQVKTHELNVTQSAAALEVKVTVTSDSHDPDHFDFHYKLDGTPTPTETQIRTPNGPVSVPTVLAAAPDANGELVITIERELTMRGNSMKATTVEHWKLSADGKTLTIARTDNRGGQTMSSTMVFLRS
ncbi:MAG TPA: hypothetical protein VF824_07075 [Thermoanaerobaculia bacterium]|jgi:hypothetical protein